MDAKENILCSLRQKGLRVTQQKSVIIDVLVTHSDRMLSANDIADALGSLLDNATVYRNMRKFLELGIVESMVDNKGVQRYKICDGTHHHHLVCTSCGRIINFPCDTPFWRCVAEQHAFKESFHRIEVFGICANCR